MADERHLENRCIAVLGMLKTDNLLSGYPFIGWDNKLSG